MSGICGYLTWSEPPERFGATGHLQRMVDAGRHLGPDGEAVYADDTLALAQFIDLQTPESTALSAPLSSGDPLVVLAADVRLDNRAALAEKLELGPGKAESWSDERLLLTCYHRWGLDCVDHLLGDYTFAIWDKRLRRLLLVRDRLGMRPLYYYRTPGGVIFGSEVNVVIAHPAFKRRVCRTRVADFLGVTFEDTELTFYEGLLRLPPASTLVVSETAISKHNYWQLQYTPELRLKDHLEYSERFRELLIESVHCRLRSRGPVGFLLSGGLDSSSIVGIAREAALRNGSGPLSTFSALFTDYPKIDERVWIDEVIATGSFSPKFVRVDRCSPTAQLPKEIGERGEPFYAPNNYVDSALLDCARQSGTRVILDGLDGDTTVGHGWEYLGELLRRGKWRRLLRLARALDQHTDKSTFWFVWRHAIGPTLSGLSSRWRGRSGVLVPALMRRAFAEEVGWVDRVWNARRGRGFDLLSDFRRQHWGKLRSGLVAMSFEAAAHQAAARGMVRRHPYFDQRLVEFCVSLPAAQRLDRGVDRIVQRRAVAGFTPESIRTRLTKSIWVQNFADRLATDDRDAIVSFLNRSSPVADFVDMSVVQSSCTRILNGRADERTLAEIWVVLALDVWLSWGW